MLFNSYPFLFGFLPIILLGFYLLRQRSREAAILWLTLGSLFFYGWWAPAYLPLILLSIAMNYGFGFLLVSQAAGGRAKRAQAVLFAAIAVNLTLLGYFKYANFFVDNLNAVGLGPWNIATVVLPIGISFFTFTQIAYLVDVYAGKAREPRFLHYALFVTYFPHLVAGPILHHKEMMPQFAREQHSPLAENLAVGFSIFVIGLFKKVVIADGIALYADPLFTAAHSGAHPAFLEAWCGALAYTFQLYFDFSGYSDMAVGLSRMLGIRLPINFDSPYKATNIAEFWRRWHMTLSRFLRDYLYIPLGGSRRGPVRRYVNLMATMLLGGLWHGAGWTFVIWGGLHGFYLVVNHAWHAVRGTVPGREAAPRAGALGRWMGRFTTFGAVVVAWVFFRATALPDALRIVRGMVGANGFDLPEAYRARLGAAATALQQMGWQFVPPSDLFEGNKELAILFLLLLFVWFLPNSQEIMRRYRPALDTAGPLPSGTAPVLWRPNFLGAAAIASLAVASILSLTHVSTFLYFQF